MVAPSEPCVPVWSSEQRVDFRPREEANQRARKTLAGYGEHALDLRRVSRELERDIAKERVDRCEAQIAAANTQTASLLEMIEKRYDQRGVDLLEGERGRRLMPMLLRKVEKQAEGVAVGTNRVGADPALLHQTLSKEALQKRGP